MEDRPGASPPAAPSVLKPAENTPLSTFKLAEIAADILPPGVLNVIGGHGDPAGAALVTHPGVDFVSLTGSPGTGKWIAKAAADTLKRVHLELGGKAPVIIFDDYDPETALEFIARRRSSTRARTAPRPPGSSPSDDGLRRRRQRPRRAGAGAT